MRLVSWNVNGIRAVAGKGLVEWMQENGADCICLQETKASPEQLGADLLEIPGYKVEFMSAQRKGYSGVATYYKREPLSVSNLGCPEFDCEGRCLLLEYPEFTLVNCYFPNSQDGGARIEYKVSFCDAVLDLCQRLVSQGKHVVVCGDYNIAHKPIDLARPKDNENSPGYLPEERAWMTKYLNAGYVDTFRVFNQSPNQYTWWSYRMRARERNVGWRIDYHCCDEGFRPFLKDACILSDVMGSDHCPIQLKLSL